MSGARGFTLLELLISLSILSIIVVLIFGALQIGVRAWERGEENVENLQRIRIVLSLMRRQLASICARNVLDDGKRPFLLGGDENSMVFLSGRGAGTIRKSGVMHVEYAVAKGADGKATLGLREMAFVNPDGESDETHGKMHALLSGMESIEFAYTGGSIGDSPLEWTRVWDPETRDEFPAAVRIILREDPETPPVTAIVRLEPGLIR